MLGNRKSIKDQRDTPRPGTDYKIRDTGQSANQHTLLHDLSTDEDPLDLDKGRNVILLQGPGSQGARNILIIHQES